MDNAKYLADFDAFMKKRLAASTAFVEGNFAPLKQISTERSPATIFGPQGNCIQGPEKVNAANEKGANSFELPAENDFEIMHQDADTRLAYWTGIQRSVVKIKGEANPISMELRVTEIFRREGEEWKLIHRHADNLRQTK